MHTFASATIIKGVAKIMNTFLFIYMEDKREQIRQLVATGKDKKYLGEKVKDFDELDSEQIDKYYERYLNVISSELGDNLSETFTRMIGEVGCKFLAIKDVEGTIADIQKDKFTGELIKKVSHNIFDTFGYYIAPITIGSIFFKHYIKDRDEEEVVNVEKIVDKVLSE